jgi:hypothetical protein
MRSLLGITMLALALSGCANTSGVMVAAQPGLAACANQVYREPDQEGGTVERQVTDRNGEPTQFLVATLVGGLTADPTHDLDPDRPNPFDAFLDCCVGEVDMRDPEQRLLRGHVVVTMLAMYGAFNLGHRRYDDLADDAALIMQAIENAELGLAAGSRLMVQAALGPSAEPEPVLTSFARVSTVMDALQVAVDVERPSQARALGGLRNLAAAIGSSGGVGIADLVLDGLRGIRKAAILEVYGGALRNDARRFLRGLDGRAVTLADWQAWDRWLDRACARIAAIGGVTNRCVPGAPALAAHLDMRTPPARTSPAIGAEVTALMR